MKLKFSNLYFVPFMRESIEIYGFDFYILGVLAPLYTFIKQGAFFNSSKF